MAQRGYGFSDRFPKAKLFLFLAVLLALPLTVLSLQNAPTNTQQNAATATCTTNGGSCYKYDCPVGNVSINGSCGSVVDSVCCAPAGNFVTQVPTGLGAYTSCITNYETTFGATITFSWNAVKNATSYRVHIYDHIATIPISASGKSVTVSKYAYPSGYKVYWTVQGYNKNSNTYGTESAKKEIVFRSCHT